MENTEETLLEQIYRLVTEKHNPNLVESDNKQSPNYVEGTSPNSNQIYHLYSNGKITHQKGAWAYLQRSEFQECSSIMGLQLDTTKFPKQFRGGYAIVTSGDAMMIRGLMIEYVKSL